MQMRLYTFLMQREAALLLLDKSPGLGKFYHVNNPRLQGLRKWVLKVLKSI